MINSIRSPPILYSLSFTLLFSLSLSLSCPLLKLQKPSILRFMFSSCWMAGVGFTCHRYSVRSIAPRKKQPRLWGSGGGRLKPALPDQTGSTTTTLGMRSLGMPPLSTMAMSGSYGRTTIFS